MRITEATVVIESFLGRWRDSMGNQVDVDWAKGNTSRGELDVWLTTKSKKVIQLSVKSRGSGRFQCGHYELDTRDSNPEHIVWVDFKEKSKTSTWKRPDNSWDKRSGDNSWSNGGAKSQDKWANDGGNWKQDGGWRQGGDKWNDKDESSWKTQDKQDGWKEGRRTNGESWKADSNQADGKDWKDDGKDWNDSKDTWKRGDGETWKSGNKQDQAASKDAPRTLPPDAMLSLSPPPLGMAAPLPIMTPPAMPPPPHETPSPTSGTADAQPRVVLAPGTDSSAARSKASRSMPLLLPPHPASLLTPGQASSTVPSMAPPAMPPPPHAKPLPMPGSAYEQVASAGGADGQSRALLSPAPGQMSSEMGLSPTSKSSGAPASMAPHHKYPSEPAEENSTPCIVLPKKMPVPAPPPGQWRTKDEIDPPADPRLNRHGPPVAEWPPAPPSLAAVASSSVPASSPAQLPPDPPQQDTELLGNASMLDDYDESPVDTYVNEHHAQQPISPAAAWPPVPPSISTSPVALSAASSASLHPESLQQHQQHQQQSAPPPPPPGMLHPPPVHSPAYPAHPHQAAYPGYPGPPLMYGQHPAYPLGGWPAHMQPGPPAEKPEKLDSQRPSAPRTDDISTGNLVCDGGRIICDGGEFVADSGSLVVDGGEIVANDGKFNLDDIPDSIVCDGGNIWVGEGSRTQASEPNSPKEDPAPSHSLHAAQPHGSHGQLAGFGAACIGSPEVTFQDGSNRTADYLNLMQSSAEPSGEQHRSEHGQATGKKHKTDRGDQERKRKRDAQSDDGSDKKRKHKRKAEVSGDEADRSRRRKSNETGKKDRERRRRRDNDSAER